ncbi:hypothetical protein AQPW35_49900 [Rubrivivax pictus]|uniref:Uncharacterized protein n=1 Tax=Pseudaquabacterium pictum TaxID=2315236 RepID=A0A480AW12_9BURK|nr:hypothetical protein AQPW35_49900 [Rubrivivax pictus]
MRLKPWAARLLNSSSVITVHNSWRARCAAAASGVSGAGRAVLMAAVRVVRQQDAAVKRATRWRGLRGAGSGPSAHVVRHPAAGQTEAVQRRQGQAPRSDDPLV